MQQKGNWNCLWKFLVVLVAIVFVVVRLPPLKTRGRSSHWRFSRVFRERKWYSSMVDCTISFNNSTQLRSVCVIDGLVCVRVWWVCVWVYVWVPDKIFGPTTPTLLLREKIPCNSSKNPGKISVLSLMSTIRSPLATCSTALLMPSTSDQPEDHAWATTHQ